MMVGTLRGIGEEFAGLLVRAGVAWWRTAAWLLGLCLLGWSGYFAAVLLGTELAFQWPWLVILGLAMGTVAQLATIVIALRLVMDRSQVLVDSVAEVPGRQPPGAIRLVARTILPFLAIYAAFGFVDDYARNVMLALQGRFSFSAIEFMNQLDPTKSNTTLAIVAGVVVALYLARRVLDRLAARRDHAWITLLGALVEASWVLLALLSLFRIVEVVKLWLNSRQLAAWGFELVELLFGWIRLTGFWLDAWEFLARQAWPAFWDVLTQPLAWLALAAVVAGIKVATSAELLQESAGGRGAGFAKVANGFFTGDLDDKFAPLWQAGRFLARAGLPLLGGYVLAFAAIDLFGDLISTGLIRLIGPQYGTAALIAMPLDELIPMVLVMSLRIALLGVTVARVSEVLASGAAAPRHRLGQAVTVFVVCLALALSSLAIRQDRTEVVVSGTVGTSLRVLDSEVTVSEPRAGRALVNSNGYSNPTELVFLVVPVAVGSVRGTTNLYPTLEAGDHLYRPWDTFGPFDTEPGFVTQKEAVFELDPADLSEELVLVLRPGGSLQLGDLRARIALPSPEPAAQVDHHERPTQWVP